MKSIVEKSYSQIGASLFITLAGLPELVEQQFNRLVNHGMAQYTSRRCDGADKEVEITAGEIGKESVTFKSNLPRFESAIDALATAKLRTTKKFAKMKNRGIVRRRILEIEKENIRKEFRREIIKYEGSGGVRITDAGNFGRVGDLIDCD